jgi:hypothetical protein
MSNFECSRNIWTLRAIYSKVTGSTYVVCIPNGLPSLAEQLKNLEICTEHNMKSGKSKEGKNDQKYSGSKT